MQRVLVLIIALIPLAGSVWADDGPPPKPAMSKEMMVALARLNMSPEQARQFGAVLKSIMGQQIDMARKALRRNKPGVDRLIKKKTRRIISKHDDELRAFLSDEQMKLWEDQVKDTLYAELTTPRGGNDGNRTRYEPRDTSTNGASSCTFC